MLMSTKELSVTEMARHFSEYINRVAYRREAFVLSRGGKPLAELRPLPSGRRLGDLPLILRSLPRLSRQDAAAFGKDLDAARRELRATELRDPWAS